MSHEIGEVDKLMDNPSGACGSCSGQILEHAYATGFLPFVHYRILGLFNEGKTSDQIFALYPAYTVTSGDAAIKVARGLDFIRQYFLNQRPDIEAEATGSRYRDGITLALSFLAQEADTEAILSRRGQQQRVLITTGLAWIINWLSIKSNPGIWDRINIEFSTDRLT